MEHIELKPFTWIHPRGSFSSRCDLDIYMLDKRAVVIATEREDDPGSGISVANGADIIATIVLQKFGLNPDAITWIEHYPEKRLSPDKPYKLDETYNLVKFNYDGSRLFAPKWERIDKEGIEALIFALKAGLENI